MTSPLENLANQTAQLTAEPFDQKEYQGLIRSGQTRLTDAQNSSLSLESRFDLAYNARMRSASRRSGARAIAPETVTSFSRCYPTHWGWGLAYGAPWPSATTSGTFPNTKVI